MPTLNKQPRFPCDAILESRIDFPAVNCARGRGGSYRIPKLGLSLMMLVIRLHPDELLWRSANAPQHLRYGADMTSLAG